MMRNGPIPLFLHGVVEYLIGLAFVVAPFLLDFQSGAATALSIVVGVAVLAIAAATDGPTSLIDEIPRPAHVALDYVLAILLIALPFLAGFSGETAPTALFIGIGILVLLITIGTRFQTRGERRDGDAPAEPPPPAPDTEPETGPEAIEPPDADSEEVGALGPAAADPLPDDGPPPDDRPVRDDYPAPERRSP